MTPISVSADPDDAALVAQSLTGDRHAFAQIVARYQSVVCALAYSVTGSRAHSEDLAQETFIAAWRNLRDLREPVRLKSWLCGIARNTIHGDLRRLGRQPTHAAAPLETAESIASADALPTMEAVSNEEMALMWREVSRLPESYREPLILYYREHKSVEKVAEALELSPDAVMQRLTRGRRLLHARMLTFIETTLERSNPGPQFTLQIEAALPLLATSSAIAGTAGSGGAVAKGGLLGLLSAWALPLVGVFAAIGISWFDLKNAPTQSERRFVARWLLGLWSSVLVLVVSLPSALWYAHQIGLDRHADWRATATPVGIWFLFAMVALTFVTLLLRHKGALRRRLIAEGAGYFDPWQLVTRWQQTVATTAVLVSLFWIQIFVAWRAGDHAVSLAIAALVLLLGTVPHWLAPKTATAEQAAKGGAWFLVISGLLFFAILNWRLNVWLAPLYGVDLRLMNRLLPMPLIHVLSAVLIGWLAALVFFTRPKPKR